MSRIASVSKIAESHDDHEDGLMDETRQAVQLERQLRGWSYNRCAAASNGLISNETWRKFELGQTGLTGTVRRGVMEAFGWPMDWPENVPAPDIVTRREDQLAEALQVLTERVEAGFAAMTSLLEALLRQRP